MERLEDSIVIDMFYSPAVSSLWLDSKNQLWNQN